VIDSDVFDGVIENKEGFSLFGVGRERNIQKIVAGSDYVARTAIRSRFK